MQPTPQSAGGEVYRIVNKSETRPFVGKLSPTQVYRVPPGGTAIVPREGVWLWTGRPWTIDRPENGIRERHEEVMRLRALYGAHCPDEKTGMVEDELWELNKPLLDVFDMTGEPVVTVIDDPFGDRISPAMQTTAEKDLLAETVDKLRRELASMQGRLNGLERGEAMPDVEVPDDEPTKVPVGPRRGREAS